MKATFGARLSLSFGFLTLFGVATRVVPWPRAGMRQVFLGLGFPDSEAEFLAVFSIAFLVGAGLLAALGMVWILERPRDWRSFFLLTGADWKGFLMLLGIGALVMVAEDLFLTRFVWSPAQDWLLKWGAWKEPSLAAPSRAYLALNLLVLVLVSWVEMAEEIYFRGYVQRELTQRLGGFRGVVLSLLLWDVWHLWNPAMLVRRFFVMLPAAVVVHLRGRVWASMLAHPLGNRLGTVLFLMSAPSA